MTQLHFMSASASWLERLPLGNGRLGVMVGTDHRGIQLGLNEAGMWSGGPGSAEREPRVDPDTAATALGRAREAYDGGDPLTAEQELTALQHRYAQSFLPIGEVSVDFLAAPAVAGVERRLSLAEAVAESRLSWPGAVINSVTAVPRTEDIVVLELRVKGTRADLGVRFSSPLRQVDAFHDQTHFTTVLAAPADVAPPHERDEATPAWEVPGIDPVQAAVHIEVDHDGTATNTDGGLTVRDCSWLRVRVAVETSYTGPMSAPDEVSATIAHARQRARVETVGIVERHRLDSRSHHEAMTLSTPRHHATVDVAGLLRDPDATAMLPLLFEFGRYLLRSSSRPGGLPANLQGIWNDQLRPPWSSDYTLNINTTMNYWGAEPTGESGFHLALLELLEGLAVTGRETASRLYGAGGWVAHHNSDAWAYSLPVRGDASYAMWPMGGAWLVRQFDEHRRHGAMAGATLRRFWPIARGAAEFLCDFLDDGETFPSTSPENKYRHGRARAALTRSSAMDRALVIEVFETVAALARAVGEPDDQVAVRCRALKDDIAPPQMAADGTVLEWDRDLEQAEPLHRHISHLYAWYPGDSGADAQHAAVRATLDARGDDSTGWSLAWKLALAARLKDVARIERLLPLIFRTADTTSSQRGGLYPNLFAAHPPFQIDGNLGFLGAVTEMLVHSHRPGQLELLPALPGALASGSVTGLVARPGILVDLEWEDRNLTRARLIARSPEAAGPVRLTWGEMAKTVDIPHGRPLVLNHELEPISTD